MVSYTDIQFIHNFNIFFLIRSWYFDMQFWIFTFDHLKSWKKKTYYSKDCRKRLSKSLSIFHFYLYLHVSVVNIEYLWFVVVIIFTDVYRNSFVFPVSFIVFVFVSPFRQLYHDDTGIIFDMSIKIVSRQTISEMSIYRSGYFFFFFFCLPVYSDKLDNFIMEQRMKQDDHNRISKTDQFDK